MDSIKTNYLKEPKVLEATTFGLFLSYARSYLPEIAWLLEIRLILETIDKRSKLKLDLKEWIFEGGPTNVIEDSINTLGQKAKTYTKAFNAILGGNETFNLEYDRVQLTQKWLELKELGKGDNEKGIKLEEFVANLFHHKFGFSVLKKNLLVETQELDIILKNTSYNNFLKSLNSPFILVECKNWITTVGVSEARVFESKYREAGNKVNLGIFITLNGISKPFKTHLNNLIRDGINLVVIDEQEIERFLYSEKLDVGLWLEEVVSNQFILK